MIGLPFSNISNDERLRCCLGPVGCRGADVLSLASDVPKAVYANVIPRRFCPKGAVIG